MLLTAANVYLGLYVGMTVSASIPAAVISMAVLRSLAKANISKGTNILENNWVQTAVSSGESLAAGVIFTLPALLVMNQTSNGEIGWSEFPYFKTLVSIGSVPFLNFINPFLIRAAVERSSGFR